MVCTKDNLMKTQISAQTFEFCKNVMTAKDNIDEGKVYVLYAEDKGGKFWQIDVEVFYDSPAGNGLVPLHSRKDMYLYGKDKYGDTWYLAI